MVTATRRLRARPSGVSFGATGMLSAWPTAVRRAACTPLAMNRRTTALARAADSSQFEAKFELLIGWTSVCPSTCTSCASSLSSTATARRAWSDSAVRRAAPGSNSTLALISTLTPRLVCVTRTLPSLTNGARVEVRSCARRVMCSRSRRRASVRRFRAGFGSGMACGASMMMGGAPFSRLKAWPMAFWKTRYLPSLTCEMAYMTTKKANSRVMKSAYEISQRSWLSGSSSYFLRARRIMISARAGGWRRALR